MLEYLKTLPSGTLIAIILAMAFVFKYIGEVVAFFFRSYWNDRKVQEDKHEKALSENTLAIVKLQIQLESLNDVLKIVPKLKEDVYLAHAMIRELKTQN